MVQGNAVGMVGAEFTGGQHRFHLADKVRECFIQLPAFDVTELAGDAGPVSQIMQSVAFLHQTGSQAQCNLPLQAPSRVAHYSSPLLSVQGDAHQAGIGPIAVLAAFGVYREDSGDIRNVPAGVMTDATVPLVFAGAVAKDSGLRMLAVYRHCPAFTDNFHVIPQSRPCSANE